MATFTENVDRAQYSKLSSYFTNEEFFYETVRGTTRLVIVLKKDVETSDSLLNELRKIVELRSTKNSHTYFKLSSCPVLVKLDNLYVYQGIREKYDDKSSKIVSLDSRISCGKGTKHVGLLSLMEALAIIGAENNVGVLKSKVKYIREIINSDDKLRWYPGARCRVLPCPTDHETCEEIWNGIGKQVVSLRESCNLSKGKHAGPLCIYARKIVSRQSPTKDLPIGIFALPPQFDIQNENYAAEIKKGFYPVRYDISQLRTGSDETKNALLQCAMKPHYLSLWHKATKDFKKAELIHGLYEVSALFLESNEKMSLQLEIVDELIHVVEERHNLLETHVGNINFSPEMYADKAQYSDDDKSFSDSEVDIQHEKKKQKFEN